MNYSLAISSTVPSETASPDFLDARPPHWVARILASLLITGAFIAVAVLALVRLPESVDCEFMIAPVGGSDPIVSRADGQVIKLLVREGANVEAGEILMVLDADESTEKSARLSSLEKQIAGLAQKAINSRAAYDLARLAEEKETSAVRIRIDALAGELRDSDALAAIEDAKFQTSRQLLANRQTGTTNDIGFQTERLNFATNVVRRYRVLHDEGIISLLQMENYELELNQTRVELRRLRDQARALALEAKQLESDHDTEKATRKLVRNKLLAEKRRQEATLAQREQTTKAAFEEFNESQRQLEQQRATLRIEADALAHSLRETRNGSYLVRAPQAGVVVNLAVQSEGAFVAAGFELCHLASPDSEMIAELTLPESGLGKVQSGQPVKLLFDAFPYQRYGAGLGRVNWISPARVRQGDQFHFPGRVALQSQHIPTAGEPFKIAAGMRGRARIVTEHRSVLARLLDPIRALRENATVPEA